MMTKLKINLMGNVVSLGAQNGSLDNKGLHGFNQWPLSHEHETFESFMKTYFYKMELLSEILSGAIC